jgi:beta-lactamase class A
MKPSRFALAPLCVLLWVYFAGAQDENRAVLRRKLGAEIERAANNLDGVMGVAIKDLTSGEEILINDQLTFPTGSSIKIPILIELHKQAASARGDENTATPREAMALMEKLYRGQVVNRQLSDDALKVLKIRKNSSIPRLLPSNVEVANKPGGIEGVACDWAVVYVPNRPYAIAVMTNYNGPDGAAADEAIAKVSKLAYDYFARLSRSTGYGARVPLELLKNKQD